MSKDNIKHDEDYHWVKRFELGTGRYAIAECGQSSENNPKLKGATLINIITCKQCRDLYFNSREKTSQKLCSFCDNPLTDQDYFNPHDLFLTCRTHKEIKQPRSQSYFIDVLVKWKNVR